MEVQELSSPLWTKFENSIQEQNNRRRILGSSYVASGLVVTLGSLVGQRETVDPAGRFVFGLSQGVGAFAFGYGLQTLMAGNELDSLYLALKTSNASAEDKSRILAVYLSEEKERQRILRNIQIATHYFVAGLNFYSASLEKDSNTKSLLNSLGFLNVVIGTTYYF